MQIREWIRECERAGVAGDGAGRDVEKEFVGSARRVVPRDIEIGQCDTKIETVLVVSRFDVTGKRDCARELVFATGHDCLSDCHVDLRASLQGGVSDFEDQPVHVCCARQYDFFWQRNRQSGDIGKNGVHIDRQRDAAQQVHPASRARVERRYGYFERTIRKPFDED